MTQDLTPQAVAERLGVNYESVRRWLNNGTLRGYKLPNRAGWRIRPGDLEEFIETRMNRPSGASPRKAKDNR